MKFLAALSLTLSLSAQVATEKPILRIETGMHTARIWRAAVDARQRFLVTASDDKTARVWDIASGRLLNILRPPIGDGKIGKLYAAAISPDGNTVACGGATSDKGESIYLFNRLTGRMIRRVSNLPNVIAHLAFSPKGEFLAVNLYGHSGVRIFRTSDFASTGQDSTYAGTAYASDFSYSPDGKLLWATTSFDGFIRLYTVSASGSVALQSKVVPILGQKPFSLKFSRDGSQLVTGFSDSPEIRILAVPTLSVLISPNIQSFSTDFVSFAWSADGDLLAAGMEGKPKSIVRWREGGRGPRTAWPVSAASTIMQLISFDPGRTLYASADPAWGIVDSNGAKLLEVKSVIADFHNQREVTAVSHLADAVRFGFELGSKAPVLFSVRNRNVTDSLTFTDERLAVTDGLPITNWEDEYEPKLEGRRLTLKPYEVSRSLAISPDHQRFVLGTEWYIRCFDRTGTPQWEVPALGVAWSVNIAPSGKVAVAWLGDGTIRWYRLTDGKELLALFPHRDRKRWVLWTPAGYYDASPGSEDLIGWHVNRGPDTAADFFPASRFRSTYYRPDVISRVLTTLDETEALRLADAEINRRRRDEEIARLTPPTVTILSPADNSPVSTTEVTLRYEARSTSGERITGIRVLVDGRPVETARSFTPTAGGAEVRVPIPNRDCQISLIAENRYAASEPANLRLKWQGAQEPFTIKPKLYILAIGINYSGPATLNYPAKDAQDFVSALTRQKGALYEDVQARVLTNEKATKGAILDGLDWIEKQTTQHSIAIIFMAGHGVNDTNGTYYFMPMDVDPSSLRRSAVADHDILTTVRNVAGKLVFFIDTCHSGNATGNTWARRGPIARDPNKFINELTSAENGAVVFAAATGNQVALESTTWNNGAFTKALVEGLTTEKADYQRNGKITITMLELYISERVKELTGGNQTPVTTKPKAIPDFPIALRR